MSELLLIPVPGSDEGGDPVLRVVLVPKLDAAPDVAAAGMADWPAVIATARLDVELDSGGDPIAGLEPRTDADPQAWRSFFGGGVRVDAAPPPAIGPMPVVAPTAEQAVAVQETYRAAAGAEVEAGVAAGDQQELGKVVARELSERWAGEEPAPPPPPPAAAVPAEQDAEFHRIVALLREHPAVMRALGLVIELPLDEAARRRLGTAGTVRVRWPQPPPGLPAIVSPRTAYEVDGDRGFVPASAGTIRAGILDLGDGDAWDTITFDVDGAVGRLRDAARTAAASEDEQARLPALRSAGIALLRLGREKDFADRRAAVAANAERASLEDAPPLTAADLLLGLRLDVRFKGESEWTSLCRRAARYEVDGRDVLPPAEEEGHVKLGAAVRQSGDVLRADEIVTRWNGWSLAVPQARPGAGDGGNGRNGRRRAAALPFDFAWEFAVPERSLLPLRFGRDYHLRARVADLAGGGSPPSDPDVALGTQPIPYVRYEPIGSPNVALPGALDPRRLGPGGTIEQLVIRVDAPDYPRNDERVLTAPTTTLDVAEQHGELDGSDATTFERVQRALAGGLPDPAAEGVTVFTRPEPGGLDDEPQLLGWRGDWPDAAPKRLRLLAKSANDDDPALRPEGDDIRVFLAPAEQVTFELSSFLKDGFLGHLALQQWRSSSAPTQVVKDGRHPMATPARAVTLVHAVRAPLATPGGVLEPQQEDGGTAATLLPSAALMGIDVPSTVQLQVTASYDEIDDDATRKVVRAPVCDVAIERGDEALRGPLVHQLGDTRHRMVSYGLTAVSRFRHLFKADEDDRLFVTQADLEPVSVRSTARPPLPAVRAVVPAFRWADLPADGGIVRRRRSGGRLRVELLRPWNLSGEGEQLAVVVAQCEIGRDPIWDTPDLARVPSGSTFVPFETSTTVQLPDDGGEVGIVPYDVKFAGDHWFADVSLPTVGEASYRPFVRLAVARYQRESLARLELSAVVRTELVQLLPDRTLTVDHRTPGTVVVTLDGLGPSGPNRNRVDVVVERSDAPAGIDVTALDSPEGGLAAWAAVAQGTGGLGEAITVAHAVSGAVRVRVREVELLAGAGQPPASQAGTAAELTERVVFTDVVRLP